jgi:hypothetical protein
MRTTVKTEDEEITSFFNFFKERRSNVVILLLDPAPLLSIYSIVRTLVRMSTILLHSFTFFTVEGLIDAFIQ